MVRTLRLPFRAIEGTSVVGPFFWASYDHDANDPHLRKICLFSPRRVLACLNLG